ncbi:MAG: hypothetical protein O2833_00040 [Proteobacteria bacterium]|jgi:hypothetical protein|nr:hypothetical protein [Pseudomonadota bacterium]HCK04546.1 hypothetical protein [Methylophilaceae bacterium]|tara:strand:- start:5360 stop:6073 length:714 start_codon:yes stop_codon:yes gene_type:complete
MIRVFIILFSLLALMSCANNTLKKKDSTQYDKSSIGQFGKSDFDRMADYEIRENIESLKVLMIKFYKRNPRELRKTASDNAEFVTDWVFNNKLAWKFPSINNAQGIEAINQTFDESFDGDRVLSLITGIFTMIKKAHNDDEDLEFFITDSLDPQKIYNASRNIEIIVWKLSNKKNAAGDFILLTNEINAKESNLSFEREFGKIIGRTDYFAYALSEKSERTITRVLQNLATALFLPF